MNLPESWREAPIGLVAEVFGGGTPDRSNVGYFGGEYLWATPTDVTRLAGYRLQTTQEQLTESGLNNSSAKLLPAGTVLLTSRATIGKTAIADVPLATNQGFVNLVPNPALVDSEFLARQLESLKPYLESRAGGSTFKEIARSAVAKVPIRLPSLPEQRRIVSVLRQAEEVVRLRDRLDDLLKRTRRQIFFEMFGDPNPRFNAKWPVVKLGNVVNVGTGGTPPREHADSFGGANAWVKSTDLKDEEITSTEEGLTEQGIQRSNAKIYPKETIFLAMYGQGQTRGRTGKLLVEAACNQACAALLPSADLLPDYLWVWFQLSYESVRSLGRGGQQENLNLDIVRNINLPAPPVELQREFSRRLTALLQSSQLLKLARIQQDGLLANLRVEALIGDATVAWRDQHATEVADAASARDAILRERGAKLALPSADIARRGVRPEIPTRPARHWLLGELSEFQRKVLAAFIAYPEQPLLAEVPDVFARFCDDADVADQAQTFGGAFNNRIRRTLGQLATLGLIAKVTLPKQDLDTGEREYLKAFRPLREDEFTRLSDVTALRSTYGVSELENEEPKE